MPLRVFGMLKGGYFTVNDHNVQRDDLHRTLAELLDRALILGYLVVNSEEDFRSRSTSDFALINTFLLQSEGIKVD